MTCIDAVSTPATEPRVFERDGAAYANTRDLAAHFGWDHCKFAQSIKQAIETDREILEFEMYENDAIEVAYRDSSGQMAVSYDLSYGAFIGFCFMFSRMFGAGRQFNLSIHTPYDHAFIDKDEEIEKRKASVEQVDTLAEQVIALKKRNAYLAQDNVRLVQQTAELTYRVHQLEIAAREELEDAVSPSLFRN